MIKFFLSLRTAVWTLFSLICVFFVGSYMMPVHRDIFSSMNEGLLFDWVSAVAVPNLTKAWWFFAALVLLALLTINTLVCSFQAVKGRWSRTDFLLRISPQIIHAGFLFILLAHLLGAGWGYRLSGVVAEGIRVKLPEGRTLAMGSINVIPDDAGYLKDWSASVALFEGERLVASGTLGPNRPLLFRGVGVYLKSLDFERGPAALLMVNKDPGAVWAFVGSVLFMLGLIPIVAVKWNAASSRPHLS